MANSSPYIVDPETPLPRIVHLGLEWVALAEAERLQRENVDLRGRLAEGAKQAHEHYQPQIDESIRENNALRSYAVKSQAVVKAARSILGMGTALIRDQGQSYNLSQTGNYQLLERAIKELDACEFEIGIVPDGALVDMPDGERMYALGPCADEEEDDPRPQVNSPTPEGWKLVPLHVTREMQRAYFDVIDKNMRRVETDAMFGRHESAKEAYRAMIAAAPPFHAIDSQASKEGRQP